MPRPTAWSTARATACLRWSSTATTAGSWCRSSRPASRPCVNDPRGAWRRGPPRGHPASERRGRAPARGAATTVALAHGTVPARGRGAGRGRSLSRRALGRAEDRRLPRPASQPAAGRQVARPGRPRARLLRLPRLVRAAPGADAPAASSRSTRARTRSAAGPPTPRSTGSPTSNGAKADAFETLRAFARARERFDTIVLDPPAFAKNRGAVPAALRGYREINLRAMRALAPGGILLTASCSFHVRLPEFLTMLVGRGRGQRPPGAAPADSGPGRGSSRGAHHPRDRLFEGGGSAGGMKASPRFDLSSR